MVPSGSVLGVDLSAKMLDGARLCAEAEGLANVTFEQVDAQVHPFPQAAFDLAVSVFGAMFFADRGVRQHTALAAPKRRAGALGLA